MTTSATSDGGRSGAAASGGPGLGRRFRIFQAAVLSSDLADGVYRVAVPLLALQLTHSALAISAVGVAMRMPWLLVTLPAGVVVDRYHPHRVLRAASWLRMPLVLLLAAAAFTGHLSVWALALGAFAVGAAGTVVDIAAQSLVPRLVDGAALPRANASLQSVQTVMAQFLGPALGGVVAALGAGGGIGSATVLYVVTLLVLGGLRTPGDGPAAEPRGGSPKSVLADLREGLGHFRGRRDLLHLAGVTACVNLAYAAAITILPLWAIAPGRLGLPSWAYGVLLAAPAVGGVAAGRFAAKALTRFGGGSVLRVCAPLVGACYMALAIPHVAAAAVALTVSGALLMAINVMSVTYRQTSIPPQLFGRVNAAYRWIIWGVLPLGSLVAGLLADAFGVAWVFLCTGGLALATGLLRAPRLAADTAAETPAATPKAPSGS
ncbi:MFS transporter [Streptomyces sp. R302]|uniref:MFS transporter n=1 Tax=unclassified Streptomyces TaxID=2593676 RepID=UPI00145C71D1|nr:MULTISPECIES: MFS transporter [unclassified Streptomyces]NML49258.1 MFS transporter [Streptomyces sp. R301]NML77585.1 MFS transporter [Streptomyces sp. R302]